MIDLVWFKEKNDLEGLCANAVKVYLKSLMTQEIVKPLILINLSMISSCK
jgi:hypothetical protein